MYLASTDKWYLERLVWLIAGIIVLTSTLLGVYTSKYWFILTGLAGFNMIIFSLTGFCPMAVILNKAGIKPLK